MEGKRKWGLLLWSTSIVLLIIAIGLYNGGDGTTLAGRFTWQTNFLSDLGRTITYGGIPQLSVRLVFITALAMIGLYVTHLARLITPVRTIKNLAIIAAVVWLLSGIISSDTALWIHRYILVAALLITSILWTSIARLTASYKTFTVVAAATLWIYFLFLLVSPRPEFSPTMETVHAQIQKAVVIFFFLNSFFLLLPRQKGVVG